LPNCRSLLFCDCGAYTVEEREEEGEIYGSGDLGSVLEVQGCELRDYALDCAIGRQEPELRLCCHRRVSKEAVEGFADGMWRKRGEAVVVGFTAMRGIL
jgi:hypothetical protein